MQQENSVSEEENQPLHKSPQHYPAGVAVAFDWEKRWLKGDQYHHILTNIHAYCSAFGFRTFQEKTHPVQIYEQPVNGMVYFVKGKGVGPDFGFPRASVKKRYRWKKMNFTTDLPKGKPYVTYVVASAMKAQAIQQGESAQYRMHAVIPYYEGRNVNENNEYILCHVRAVDHKKERQHWDFHSCFVEQYADFYRLFAFLHNHNLSMQKE